MTNSEVTRRRLLGSSAALASGFALGSRDGASAAPAPAPSAVRRSRQQFQGQLILSPIQNPPDEAKNALVEAYRQQQPDVEVVWETQDFDPGTYPTWLGTQLSSDDIRPDIVSAQEQPTYRGYVNFDQYRTVTNPYTGNPWDQDLDFDFYRGTNNQGERIMLPTRSVHINWFYNQDLFTRAGVEPPTTWEAFGEICAKLQEAGVTPVSIHHDYQVGQWFAEVYFDQYHVDWVETVRAKEGDWNYDPALDGAFVFDPQNPHLHNTYTFSAQRFFRGIRDGELRFDTPEIAAVIGKMGELFPRYATSDFWVIEDPYIPFLQQQAAIMPGGSWTLSELSKDMEAISPERLEELGIEDGSIQPFAWSTFENPPMEGDLVKSPVRSVESASGEYAGIIDKNQQQTDLALDFMMFWYSSAGYTPYLDAYAQSAEFNPAGPLMISGVQDPPEIQELFANIQILGNAENSYNWYWTDGGGGVLKQDLRGLQKEGLEGTLSPEEYGKQVQAYFSENFEAIIEASSLTMQDIDDPTRQPGT